MSSRLTPRECEEQTFLFEWAALERRRYPELKLMFHIPNEGKRNSVTGERLVRMGLKKGVPDIFLPAARGKWHGLFIELKRMEGGELSDEQALWLDELERQCYKAIVCRGWLEAADAIREYLGG